MALVAEDVVPMAALAQMPQMVQIDFTGTNQNDDRRFIATVCHIHVFVIN